CTTGGAIVVINFDYW
nr:immunoglobulin heavy chain junction region [Macaca mulatta]MOW75123.1 immunoglobulin heavy chain junction region [Macaca mulatta]MOW75430.1 immunoglobulin heavy chain junction region [Macaca mulatta]MOW75445.1 immunoglobulin heavy chain junction region [Macaca mulatta]MOW75448.1 immunoglobulin heavy chain junction region [Macaca mulatta]